MAPQHLRDQIRLAFPPVEFYGPITICDCDECTDFRKELQHKRWDQISNAFLDLTCSTMLLTPEATQAFLPAYLLRALDDLSEHSVVVEFTVYSLCPNNPEEYSEKELAESVNERLQTARLMSPDQIEAIRAFLLFVQENAGSGEWFRPFIALALERVWQ